MPISLRPGAAKSAPGGPSRGVSRMSVTIFDPTPCALGEGPLFAHGRLFWFDILKKVVNIRGSGANPDEKK